MESSARVPSRSRPATSAPSRRTSSGRKFVWRVGAYAAWVVGCGIVLFPILWTVTESLKSPIDIASKPPFWIGKPYFENYRVAFSSFGFGGSLLNSAIAVVVSVTCAVLVAIPAAYAIVRRTGSLSRFGLGWAWILRVTPGIIVLIPLFVVFKQLDSPPRFNLILIYFLYGLPLMTTALVAFFATVPKEIEEAAAVDGAGHWATLTRIVIPVALPGIIAAGVLTFVLTWGDLLFALVLTDQETATAPITVLSFIRGSVGIDWGPLTAGVTVIMFPVIVFGVAFHRYLVAGMAAGAVK